MIAYWSSTKSAMRYRHAHDSAKRSDIVRSNVDVDPAHLTASMKLNEVHVRAYQRRLGLRHSLFRENHA